MNNSWHDATEYLDPPAITLCDVTGKMHNLSDVLIRTLRSIAARADQLRTGSANLKASFQRLNICRGRRVTLKTDGRQVEGMCVEIAADGAIVVETASGRGRFYSGTLRLHDANLAASGANGLGVTYN